MGEVYRARDTRLGRDVALKVSHEKFTERFEQEARVDRGAESSEHLPSLRCRPELSRHGTG